MNERSFSPTPLNKRSLSDEIVFQIKEMIADGRLQPNQKLPTEQELCQAFSVGRTTVREALMGLTALGLVRRDKHNSYVTDAVEHPLQEFYLHLIMDNYDIAQLYEARLMLEGSVIRLACRRAAPEQIRRLEELTAHPEERAAMSRRAAESAEAFSAERFAAHVEEIYREQLTRRGGRAVQSVIA